MLRSCEVNPKPIFIRTIKEIKMAFSITFKSLRAGANDSPYVVNIGGTGGTALMGGAQPFVTQEDDDEDMFIPVRK
jgi:hypothetical protein